MIPNRELDSLMDEFELAQDLVAELPSGDAKHDRIALLLKVKDRILKADKLHRDGKAILDAVWEARDAIQEVFLSTHCMPVIPPPLSNLARTKPLAELVQDAEGWVQLNLPDIK